MNLKAQNVRRIQAVSAVAIGALLLAGCAGGTSSPDDASGEAPAELAPKVDVIDPSVSDDASGAVTLCGNNDAGAFGALIGSFNASQSAVTASYQALGPNTTETRQQAIQRLEGGQTDCDVYLTDVVWTAEWATQGWIYDQTKLIEEIGGPLLKSAVGTTAYDGRNWMTPYYTNAGLLFYRGDRVSEPATLPDLYAQAETAPENAMLLGLSAYEGLTTNFLEVLYSAGGEVLDDSGDIKIDSKETRAALELLKGALDSGAIDPASLTYDDGGARKAFESGAGGFMRNWPSAYASALQADAVKDVVKVAPLPAFDDSREAAGVLGGWNLAVPLNTKNLPGAVALLKYAASPEFQKELFLKTTQAPVVEEVYEDADAKAAIPFTDQLYAAVKSAKSRPKSPVYAQISSAIYDNVYAVLSGQAKADDAIEKMVTQIQAAQDTF